MVKLVDTPDLGSGAARCGGSTPSIRTLFVRHTQETVITTTLIQSEAPLKATVTSPKSYLKVLEVEIPSDEISQKFDAKVIKAKKEIKLPGFRNGKVPAKTIIAKFGDSIKAEAIDEAMNEAYRTACIENEINPVGEPLIEDVKVDDDAPVTFKATIQIDPEVTIKGYEKLGVTVGTDTPTDKDLAEALANVLEQFAEMKPVDRKSKKGDALTLAYSNVVVDGETLDGFQPAPQMIELGKAPVKELDKELKGLTTDEEKEISLTFPEDYAMQEVKGKKATFTVKVESVQERIAQEINEEFLTKIGVESEEKLRSTIKEDLEKQKDQANKTEAYDKAIDMIIKKNDFDVAPARVDNYLEHIRKDEEKYFPNGGQPSVEEYRTRYEETAIKSLKRFRILEAIAKDTKLKATGEEVDAKIQEIADQYQQPFDTVKDAFRQNGTTMQIREDVKEQKALACLVGLAEWPSKEK